MEQLNLEIYTPGELAIMATNAKVAITDKKMFARWKREFEEFQKQKADNANIKTVPNS